MFGALKMRTSNISFDSRKANHMALEKTNHKPSVVLKHYNLYYCCNKLTEYTEIKITQHDNVDL